MGNFKFQSAVSLLLFLLVSQAAAGTVWNLTDSQFHSRSISVDSIDSAGIHYGSELLSWNDVFEISQPATTSAPANGRLSLIFRGGDKLYGDPASFNGDTLQWNSDSVGKMSFPVESLIGILQRAYTGADLDETRTDDVIHLANGDTMHGIVNAITSAGVTLQVGDATPTLGWDAISAVLFATPPGNPAHSQKRSFRISLAGEEAIDAADVSLTNGQLTLTLADKSTRQLYAGSVYGIEQLNGPVEWLTFLKPSKNIYRPLFSESFPTRFDKTVADDKPITQRYPAFHHGIGCHSYSKLDYSLEGDWAGFRTQFAIDSDSPLADVTVRIYLDDKPVFEEKNVKAGRMHPVVAIPLEGAKTLSLEVDYGENFATEDRFVWLDPALVRTLSPSSTQP
jgi:hypothetical protein